MGGRGNLLTGFWKDLQWITIFLNKLFSVTRPTFTRVDLSTNKIARFGEMKTLK